MIGGGGEPVPIIVLQFCVRFVRGFSLWGAFGGGYRCQLIAAVVIIVTDARRRSAKKGVKRTNCGNGKLLFVCFCNSL